MFLFSKKYYLLFFLPIILSVLICILYVPALSKNYNFTLSTSNSNKNISKFTLSSSGFVWPVPGFTTITSPYGRRTSPTRGASTFHSGIDIGASPGSNLIAALDGKITYTGFYGSGGYTIMLDCGDFVLIYHHVSPNFTVTKDEYVYQGQIIGQVGPKNVYGVSNNPYKDSNGNPTNGATTGPHLHFTVKKNNQTVNPLDYF